MELAQPRIVCACNIVIGPDNIEYKLVGARHFDMTMHSQLNLLIELWMKKGYDSGNRERLWTHDMVNHQGFIDQFGNYHNRQEAWKIATNSNQIFRHISGSEGCLFSEHLY